MLKTGALSGGVALSPRAASSYLLLPSFAILEEMSLAETYAPCKIVASQKSDPPAHEDSQEAHIQYNSLGWRQRALVYGCSNILFSNPRARDAQSFEAEQENARLIYIESR